MRQVICLAHADLKDEINETSMSFINLKYPIKFNSEFNDPVKIVLTFATKDKEEHLNALLEFMDIINNQGDLKKLKDTSSKDEVLDIFTKYKKKLKSLKFIYKEEKYMKKRRNTSF